MKPYITCRQLIDFIMSYRDDELSAEERAEFERHLRACPACQVYLASYDTSVTLTRRSGHDPAPEDVPESLVAAILAARHASR